MPTPWPSDLLLLYGDPEPSSGLLLLVEGYPDRSSLVLIPDSDMVGGGFDPDSPSSSSVNIPALTGPPPRKPLDSVDDLLTPPPRLRERALLREDCLDICAPPAFPEYGEAFNPLSRERLLLERDVDADFLEAPPPPP